MSAPFRRVILSDSDEENSPPPTQSSTTAEASQAPEKRKRIFAEYEEVRKLDAMQFEEWWSKEKEKWTREKTTENEDEVVVTYYCRRYKKRAGSNCQHKLKVTMKNDNYEVAKSKGDHEHHEEIALTHEVKSLTRDLLADGRTPGQVRNKLNDKGFTPTLKQIENFIAREKRKSVDSDTRKAIMNDIHDLQLCTDDSQFERAAELLREHWRTEYPANASVDEFSTYFFKEWICGPLRFWYEGASKFISTKNGLESLNKQTKELDIDRKKVSFRAFVDIVEKIVNRWSALPDYSEVASEPKISPDTYVQAYQLSSAREGRLQVGDNDGRFVLVPSAKNKNVSAEQLLDIDTIDPSGPWFRCTCPVGMKKSACKHGLRLMCSKKLKAYPPDSKAIPIEPRRVKKRGRPTKEKPQIRF